MLKRVYNKGKSLISDRRFAKFASQVNQKTWDNHQEIFDWAYAQVDDNNYPSSPVIAKGIALRNEVLENFKNKYASTKEKYLIHVPPKDISPGGYSLFTNIIDSLNYIGITAKALDWYDDFVTVVNEFAPTVFLSSDNLEYRSKIDWEFISSYKNANQLKVGLTASLAQYGNSPLNARLTWGLKNIDFYYSFRSKEYHEARPEYKPFFDYGFEILNIEFGANPLFYYPVQIKDKDLDYVFLASSNPDKHKRYFKFLPLILRNSYGFIDGPGWPYITNYASKEVHRFLYARAKVGLNLHIDDSIDWPSELNERTYILAACGVPQIVDSAKLIPKRFSSKSLFVANSPKEYHDMYYEILNNKNLGESSALNALDEVFNKHTTLHRAESFFLQLNK